MSKKMTQEEIAAWKKRLQIQLDAVRELYNEVYPASEKQEPQEGEYRIVGDAIWIYRDTLIFSLCKFYPDATPATRRCAKMMVKMYKWAIKNLPRLEDEIHQGGAQFFCGDDTDELHAIVKFIQTGEE